MNIQQTPTLRGFEAIPELLRRAGVDTVFGLLGGSNASWVAHGTHAGLHQFIRTRHEETAVTAAAGYSRATGRLGVCTTTKGPGFTNSVNALIAATRGHVPLLHITGESRISRTKALGSSQEIDQPALAEIIGAGYHTVVAGADLEATFWTAVRAALHNGQPQILSLSDVWMEDTVPLSADTPDFHPDLAPDDASVRAVIDELALARNPLILAGWGAVLSDCRAQLTELAEHSGARLANTLRANRYFSGHDSNLGLCGSWSPQAVREVINQSDFVLAVGASFSKHTTEAGVIFGGAKVAQCEIDEGARYAASSPDLFLFGDAAVTAGALLREWKRRDLPRRPAPVAGPTRQAIRDAYLGVELHHDPARGLDPRAVYVALDQIFPPDRIVVTDNGRFLATIPSLLDAQDAKSWLIGNSYGSIGLGLGAAIGVATAHPDRKVLLISGDGGFAMSTQDLDAIRQAGLDNITIAIMNDEIYGADLRYLRRTGLPDTVLRQPLPDIAALAAVYGGTGHLITQIAQLQDLEMNKPGLTILDMRIDPEVNVREAV
jgi:acetolactate synthase-1/2/3 large subunit